MTLSELLVGHPQKGSALANPLMVIRIGEEHQEWVEIRYMQLLSLLKIAGKQKKYSDALASELS